MTIYPSQFFGIGDIIFTQTLVKEIAGDHPIAWGVLPQFEDGLERAYGGDSLSFWNYHRLAIDYEWKEDFTDGDMRYLPIRWADSILKVPYDQCMRAKYDMYGLDYRDWKKDAMWTRNTEKENELFKLLRLKKNDTYVLFNPVFQSDFNGSNVDFSFPNIDYKMITMGPIHGFSMFDWAKVMEHATEIHSVSTATLYMFELLDLKCPIHLYPRPTDPKFKQVDYLFTKNYILH